MVLKCNKQNEDFDDVPTTDVNTFEDAITSH